MMIDLSSDTATLPSAAMKKAMFDAPLGDEQKLEDPTTRKLQEMAAELLGMDEALFFPSATMANQVAIRTLCQPGSELIAAENCHLFFAESGGIAIHSGVMPRPISTATGIFTAEDLRKARHWSIASHHPRASCMSVENTTNLGGGLAWDINIFQSVLSEAKKLDLYTHLDGSRLFNAAVKLKIKPKLMTQHFDTVTLCLSKGLGCPMGAILAFKKSNLEMIRKLKHLFGGALRQSGIVAAAGIYALQNNIERLSEDHENADLFAQKISEEIPTISVEQNPLSTNMVFFTWTGQNITPAEFLMACKVKGLCFSQSGKSRFRAVFHLDIDQKNIHTAIAILKEISKI